MKFTLNNQKEVPALGFGTWRSEKEDAYNSTLKALEVGYRHIDTAAVYGNELQVGQAIEDSEVPREDIFLTTKLWNSNQGYEKTKKAFQKSLTNLGVDYIDLYLIHWHKGYYLAKESWRAMEELVGNGKIKSIGVSNFKQNHLESILQSSKIKPVINQVECNISVMNETLHKYMKENNVLMQAYAPLGSNKSSELLKKPSLIKLADKYKVKPSNIVLRYLIQRGINPLPKSITPSRIEENFNVFNFELTKPEIENIKAFNKEEKAFPDTDYISF